MYNCISMYAYLANEDYYYYKVGQRCETVLLTVYTDIVTTIGRGNGDMPVLLDLSAAFETIDHDNLFCIL